MGYTTEFTGAFRFSKLPSAETIVSLRSLEGVDGEDFNKHAPRSYCQWEMSKDCMSLVWDGGEKFYNYEEWLQFIYDTYLKPDGVELLGEIKFQGEEFGDCGTLAFVGGKLAKKKLQLVSDELDELIRFRDFVMRSDYKDELLQEWKRTKN
jgi:hypothetical protein